MSVVFSKKSTITLYANPKDLVSHQVRIVLREKDIQAEFVAVDPAQIAGSLFEINPYGTLPTLVDRDLVLYDIRIILEYLDERFPHPPLLPVYPILRAEARRMLYRFEKDWYPLLNRLLKEEGAAAELQTAKKELIALFMDMAENLINKNYLLNEEFSLVDCCFAPLLWRLSKIGIKLPKQAKPLVDYAHKIFKRPAFQSSLTEFERELAVV
jgi:RNA polymerase-associated protein